MATRTSNASGLWSATSTWLEGVVPVSGDAVTINSGHTVTVAANATCTSIVVEFGTLLIEQATASTHVTVTATSLTVNPRGVITVNGAFEQIATGTGAASQVVTGWKTGQRALWISESGVVKPWANISSHGGFAAGSPFTTGEWGKVFTSTTTSATFGNGTLGNVIPSGALVYSPNIFITLTGALSIKGMFNNFSKCFIHAGSTAIDNYSSYNFTDCFIYTTSSTQNATGTFTRCVIGGVYPVWFSGAVGVSNCFLLGGYDASYVNQSTSFVLTTLLAPVTFSGTTIVGDWQCYDYANYYASAATMSTAGETTFDNCSFRGIVTGQGTIRIINNSNFIGSSRYASLYIPCGLIDFGLANISKLVIANSTLTTEKLVGVANTDYSAPGTIVYDITNSTITQSQSLGYDIPLGSGSIIYNSNINLTGLLAASSSVTNLSLINVTSSTYSSIVCYPLNIYWKWCPFTVSSFGSYSGFDCPIGEFYTGTTTGKIVCFSVRTTAARSGIVNYGGSARISGFFIYLPFVDDYVEWAWPHKIIGMTSFQNVAATITSVNPSNMALTYSIDGGAYKSLTAANLSGETISASDGFNLKIRATCTTASTTNTISKIDIPCNVDKNVPYSMSTVTLKLDNVIPGSTYRISKTSDNSQIVSDTAGGSSVSISNIPYSGDTAVTVRVRKAGYVPFETGGTITSAGLTTFVSQTEDTIYQ